MLLAASESWELKHSTNWELIKWKQSFCKIRRGREVEEREGSGEKDRKQDISCTGMNMIIIYI